MYDFFSVSFYSFFSVIYLFHYQDVACESCILYFEFGKVLL